MAEISAPIRTYFSWPEQKEPGRNALGIFAVLDGDVQKLMINVGGKARLLSHEETLELIGVLSKFQADHIVMAHHVGELHTPASEL